MTRHAKPDPLLDATVRIDSLPPEGREIAVDSTAEQRARIAARLGITAVESLAARLRAEAFRGGIRVIGTLEAMIEQPCVVTLEPVHQAISEVVDRVLLPGRTPHKPHQEVYLDLEAEDEPDYFEGPEADLAPLLLETLALAIDLYPRAEGAELDAAGIDEEGARESPFAALGALKGRRS